MLLLTGSTAVAAPVVIYTYTIETITSQQGMLAIDSAYYFYRSRKMIKHLIYNWVKLYFWGFLAIFRAVDSSNRQTDRTEQAG